MPELMLPLNTDPECFIEWLRHETVGRNWERMHERYPIDHRDADFLEKVIGVRGHDDQIRISNVSPQWWGTENDWMGYATGTEWVGRTISFEADVRVVRYLSLEGLHRGDLSDCTGDDLDPNDPAAYETVGAVSLGEGLTFHLTRRS